MIRLKELRIKHGLSQQKLAMDLDLNQNSISRYESGARQADYQTLIAFADYFQVSVDYLLGRTDYPEFYNPISNAKNSHDKSNTPRQATGHDLTSF